MFVDIVGAGIGGLTLGIALKKKGFKIRVFDKAKVLKPVGAGIVLANNAMQVYHKLGVANAIYQKGNPISTINITEASLHIISNTHLLDFEKKSGVKNTAIHRGDLQQVLLSQIEEEELFLDHQLEGVKEENGVQTLVFGNGKVYLSECLIGADGIFSKVRNLKFPKTLIRNAHQVCWRGVLNAQLPTQYLKSASEAWGKGSRFGFVQLNPQKVYWYALKSIKPLESRFHFEKEKELFGDYDPLVLALINQTEKHQIHTSLMQDVKPFTGWSAHRVCLIGDAAHATTPNMGQGACQAIEDAFVLSNCMEKYSDLQEAFRVFEKLRRPKAHKVVKMSFALGKLSHLSNKILIRIRNLMLKMMPTKMNQKQMQYLFKLPQT